jgi:beta-glucanase (GH16 family)
MSQRSLANNHTSRSHHLALLMFAFLLHACGSGGSAPTEASSPTVVAPAPSPAPLPTPAVNLPPVAVTEPPINPSIDTSVTAPAIAGWTLVWSDEFSTPGLPNPAKWTYDTERNRLGWYNNELQYYSAARIENSSVSNGRLVITARQEKLTKASDYGNQNYTSARLITRGLASWTYGFWEIRAKLPCGLGTWPAIWTLGTGGRWPDDGEIDIMEQKGTSAAEKQQILGTIHSRAYNWQGGTLGVAKGATRSLFNACTDFNNYQMTWDADSITIGVNGSNYFQYVNPKNGDIRQWPFNAPQYLLLNLAIGGDLGGAVNNAQLPAQMEVDYVRVYSR